MKFLNFIHLLISTIFFNYVASSGRDERVESCVERRVRDNENSWNEWENLHSFSSGDARAQVNMTRQNLQSINPTHFKFTDPERRSSIIILDLSVNRISHIEDRTFERLHNLRILLLRVNSLREIIASQFKGLMMLEELDLSRNFIHAIERDTLRHMERLRTIDLSANCLHDLTPYIFFRNIRLINIYFNDNYLDTLPVLMPHSQRIEHLNVTANRFTNLTSLRYYENIQSLDISHNPMSKEMSGRMTDVDENGRGSDSDSSSNSRSEENNYTMRLHYNSNEYIHRRPRSLRHDNQDYFSKASAVNSIGRRCARVNGAEYNDNFQFIFERMSEEALEALIRLSLNADDVALCSAFNVNRKVMKRSPRNDFYVQLTRQQIQQLQELRINRLENFTCRNCSLQSLEFLVHYPKLKYVDVSGNMIKSVGSFASNEHIEYLDFSDNNFESFNVVSLTENCPKFNFLNLDGNSKLKCEMVAKMRSHVEHLNRVFKLKVNKCK